MAPFVFCTPRIGAQCRAANDSSYDMVEMIKSYALATDSTAAVIE
jgi:hypothetical protein